MKSPSFKVVLEREKRFGVDVSDISVYICLIDIRSKSKEQLNERRAGLSNEEPLQECVLEFNEVCSTEDDEKWHNVPAHPALNVIEVILAV